MEKHVVGNVPVEELIPDEIKVNHVVLHLHGGGYVAGINDVYRDIATQYSQVAGGARVFSIDYRLGPTNKFPSALDDAVLVYKWLIEQGHSEIVIVGDSAGGNLTLATTLYLKDHEIPLPKAVIGISAWTALGHELPSIKFNNSRDALLGKDGAEAKREIEHSSYFEDTDINSPYTSPMLGDYKGFPPFLLQVGSYERFYDEILITA